MQPVPKQPKHFVRRGLVALDCLPTGEHFIGKRSPFPEIAWGGDNFKPLLAKAGGGANHASRLHHQRDSTDAMLTQNSAAIKGILMSGTRPSFHPDLGIRNAGSHQQVAHTGRAAVSAADSKNRQWLPVLMQPGCKPRARIGV